MIVKNNKMITQLSENLKCARCPIIQEQKHQICPFKPPKIFILYLWQKNT